MRFMVCEHIWHGFDVLYCHLLLMMDFDCPLAFRHKRGSTYEFQHLYLFLFSGGEFIFVGWSLWCCLDCISVLYFVLFFLALATFVFSCCDIHVKGSIFFIYRSICFLYICFLFQTALLTYVYEFFIDMSLLYVVLKSRFYFTCLYFFSTHAVTHFV